MSLDEYYGRLELPGTASTADIKRAYRRLRAKYHPDRNRGRESTVEPEFKRVQEAFEILIGEREPPVRGPVSASASTSAGDRAEASSREHRGSPPMRGANCRAELFVPLDIAINGGDVEASYPVSAPCSQCGGKGIACATCVGTGIETCRKTETVAVPAGAWDGQRLVVAGAGHPGPNGGPCGDAIFSVAIVCGAAFRRDGLNLACEIQVDFVTATLGGSVSAQILGRALQVAIAPNAHPGTTIRLPGQGLADRHGSRGDLTLCLALAMPAEVSHLSDGDRRRLREMFANARQRAAQAAPARSQDDS